MKIKIGKQRSPATFVEDLRDTYAIGMNPDTGQTRLGFLSKQ